MNQFQLAYVHRRTSTYFDFDLETGRGKGIVFEEVKAEFWSNYQQAVIQMNRETAIRRTLTPDVLDNVGEKLVDLARQNNCGARFTGAGGGGCLWAVGEIENIDRLRPVWQKTLSAREEACLLDVKIDSKGLCVE